MWSDVEWRLEFMSCIKPDVIVECTICIVYENGMSRVWRFFISPFCHVEEGNKMDFHQISLHKWKLLSFVQCIIQNARLVYHACGRTLASLDVHKSKASCNLYKRERIKSCTGKISPFTFMQDAILYYSWWKFISTVSIARENAEGKWIMQKCSLEIQNSERFKNLNTVKSVERVH